MAFFLEFFMEIYVYSDESGVFDNKNETIFIYGGLVFFSKQDKENATRKYKSKKRLSQNMLKILS